MLDPRFRPAACAALLGAALAVAACGQKGPLYLPEEDSEPSQVRPRPEPDTSPPGQQAGDAQGSADQDAEDAGSDSGS